MFSNFRTICTFRFGKELCGGTLFPNTTAIITNRTGAELERLLS